MTGAEISTEGRRRFVLAAEANEHDGCLVTVAFYDGDDERNLVLAACRH
jgi:hypothetical protein